MIVIVRAVLVGFATLALLGLVFGPAAYAEATGGPLYLDCGALEFKVCDQVWLEKAAELEQLGDSGPVTWVVIEPVSGTCGTYTIGRWWLFGIFRTSAIPL